MIPEALFNWEVWDRGLTIATFIIVAATFLRMP